MPVTAKDRALLEFVDTLSRHAYRITTATVQRMRDHGWTDPQIAEAVYIGSFFNMMVRIADAFGALPPPVTDDEGIPTAVAADGG